MKITVFLLFQIFGNDSQEEDLPVRLYYNFSASSIDRDEVMGLAFSAGAPFRWAADRFILGIDPEEQNRTERFLRSSLAFALLSPIEGMISGSSHEYGHFRVQSMAGMNEPEFVNEGDESDRYAASPFNAAWQTFSQNLLGAERFGAGQSREEELEFDIDPEFFLYRTEISCLAEADGLNQNQYNAEIFGDLVYSGRVNFLHSAGYFTNLLATSAFLIAPAGKNRGGDIFDYIEGLGKLGIETSNKEILLSQLPKFLSNSTISYALAVLDYILTGGKIVEPLHLELGKFKIYWPEFASYLTLAGPTVKSSFRVEAFQQNATFSYEQSLAKNVGELGIAWRGRLTKFLDGEISFSHTIKGSGYWFEAGPTIKVFDWLSLGCKAYCGEGRTFRRQIVGNEFDFLEESESGIKGFIEINLNF